jgi:hypothetical protein
MDTLFDQSPDLSNAFLYLDNYIQTTNTGLPPMFADVWRKEQLDMIKTCKKEQCFTIDVMTQDCRDCLTVYFFPTVLIEQLRMNYELNPKFSMKKHPFSPDVLYTMKHSQLVPTYASIGKIIKAYEKKPVFKEVSLEMEQESLMEEKRQLLLVKQKLEVMKRQLDLERSEFEQEKLKQQTDVLKDLHDYFHLYGPSRKDTE